MMKHSGKIRLLLLVFIIQVISHEATAQVDSSLIVMINGLSPYELVAHKPTDRVTGEDSVVVMNFLREASETGSSDPDSSVILLKKALDGALRTGSAELVSGTIQDIGIYFLRNSMFREAMSCYLKSMDIELLRNDALRIAEMNISLGYVYRGMNVFDKALEYYLKALEIYKVENDTTGIANAYYNIGGLYSVRFYCETRNEEESRGDYQNGLDYYGLARDLYLQLGDSTRIADINHGTAFIYNKMGRFEEALPNIRNALKYYRKVNDTNRLANALLFTATLYRSLKDYDKSVIAIEEAMEVMQANNITMGVQYLYEELADTYYRSGDYKKAYESYTKYMTLDAEAVNEEHSREVFELEAKYQTQLKENQILNLTAEKKRKNALVYTLLTIIILLASSIYYYVNLLRKNKIITEQKIQIKERKIQELEKERLYLAARSVMEGEEAERSRLASDLHNGLGGLLSGIKINLSSMKENAIITHESLSAFNHAISLLDTSISELRRIAHNLMPETLDHYGLKTAIEDFCAQVSPAGKPEIDVKFFGDEIRYTKDIELTMYRVIQELVNNALKHSAATLINVQVFSESRRLFAQVIDNGKGFDSAAKSQTGKGKGLENISDRITALNGKLEIWSQPGQGSEISAEIFIS